MRHLKIVCLLLVMIMITSCTKDDYNEMFSKSPIFSSSGIVFKSILHSPMGTSHLYVPLDESALYVNDFSGGGVNVHIDENCIWGTVIDNVLFGGQGLFLNAGNDSLLSVYKTDNGNHVLAGEGYNLLRCYNEGELVFEYNGLFQGVVNLSLNHEHRTLLWSVCDTVVEGVVQKMQTVAVGFKDTDIINFSTGDAATADLITFSKISSVEGFNKPTSIQLIGENISQLQISNSLVSSTLCRSTVEIDRDIKR